MFYIITAPIKLSHFHIAHYLELDNYKNKKSQFNQTQTNKLSQIYYGSVFINGSLTVNIAFAHKKEIINSDLKPIKYLNFSKYYWSKYHSQTIRKSSFSVNTIGNQLIFRNQFNDHKIDYILYGNDLANGYIQINFDNSVYIDGNIGTAHSPLRSRLIDIYQYSKSLVDYVQIGSVKNFNSLSVGDITTDLALNRNNSFVLHKDNKLFTSVLNLYHVGFMILSSNNISITAVNSAKLSYAFSNILLITYNHIASIQFTNDLKSQKYTIISNIVPTIAIGSSTTCNIFHIYNDVQIDGNIHVNFINHYSYDYLDLLVSDSLTPVQLGGRKHFLNTCLFKENLNIEWLNRKIPKNFENIVTQFSNLHLRNKWYFTELYTNLSEFFSMNNIDVDSLININSFDIKLSSHIKILHLLVNDIIISNTVLLNRLKFNSLFSYTSHWKSMKISRRSQISINNHLFLYELMYNSLRNQGEQIVKGKITLLRPTIINYISTNMDMAILKMINDALQKALHSQTLHGIIRFQSSIIIENNWRSNKYINSNRLNHISISKFADKLNLNSNTFSICNKKKFLYTKILILRFENEDNYLQMLTIPSLCGREQKFNFHNRIISRNILLFELQNKNMIKSSLGQISSWKFYNFYQLLEVNQLKIYNNVMLHSLNDIYNYNWITNKTNSQYTITGKKKISFSFETYIPLKSELINELNFQNILNTTVLLNKPTEVSNIFLPNVLLKRGLTVINKMNGVNSLFNINETTIMNSNTTHHYSNMQYLEQHFKRHFGAYITYFERNSVQFPINIIHKTYYNEIDKYSMNRVLSLKNNQIIIEKYTFTNFFQLTKNNVTVSLVEIKNDPAKFNSTNVTIIWHGGDDNVLYKSHIKYNSKIYNINIVSNNVLILQNEHCIDIFKIDLNYNKVIPLQAIKHISKQHIFQVLECSKNCFLIIHTNDFILISIMDQYTKFVATQRIPGSFDIAFGINLKEFKDCIMILSKMFSSEIYTFKYSLRNRYRFKVFQFIKTTYVIKIIEKFLINSKYLF